MPPMSELHPNPQRVQTLRNLHEQAQRAGQELAVRLRRAQAEQLQAENKLRSLEQFSAQYRQQLEEQERRGGAWSQVRDLRAFLDRLAAAQAQQRSEVERARGACAAQQQAWTAARQKEKAFEVLLAQEHGVALAQQRKRQQADLQEWSLNRRPGFADSFSDSQNSRLGDTRPSRRR